MPETFSDDMTGLPGFLFIDHLAIAVKKGELEIQIQQYQQLGFTEIHQETMLGNDQVRESLMRIGNSPNLIQLIEPLNETSPIQKWIDRNGGRGGMNHVGFRVRNASEAHNYLKGQGFNIIDPAPRPGSRGTIVFFLHPKSRVEHSFGVLIEIVEEPKL
ncbi:MAG: VOC family protein [SAR324 cluster bacterium]|nr:VOC family protein [SAR324 cluster bacterium]